MTEGFRRIVVGVTAKRSHPELVDQLVNLGVTSRPHPDAFRIGAWLYDNDNDTYKRLLQEWREWHAAQQPQLDA